VNALTSLGQRQVGFIKGCAVQSMIDPKNFDIEEFLSAMQGLMRRLAPSTSV